MARGEQAVRHINRRSFTLASLGAASLLLSSCVRRVPVSGSSKNEGKTPDNVVRGGTFKYQITGFSSIDPFYLEEQEGMAIVHALFDSLTQYDFMKNRLEPLACESWETNEYLDSFTFHLRIGAKFHNGDFVTARDFKYAWERLCSPDGYGNPSKLVYHLSQIVGYEEFVSGSAADIPGIIAIDDNTLKVDLISPYADFPYVVSHPSLAPIPSNTTDFSEFTRMPVGNGPFKMDEEQDFSTGVKLKRFDDYYAEKPHIDGVNYLIYADVDKAFEEFEAGNLDFVKIPSSKFKQVSESFGVSDPPSWTANPGKQVISGSGLSTYFIMANHKDELAAQLGMRKLISYVLDRQKVVQELLEGKAQPAGSIIPPGISGYKEGVWEACTYNPQKAAEILDELGYTLNEEGKRSLSLSMLYCKDLEADVKLMTYLQSELAELGVDLVFNALGWQDYIEAISSSNYQFASFTWVADYPIIDNFLFPLFYTGNGDNRCSYSKPEFDDALLAARSVADEYNRMLAFQNCVDMLGEDLPVIPISYQCHQQLCSKRVNNLFYGPNKLARLSLCWLSE